MANIWDRQDKEPENAWEAFVKYRDRGPGRSLTRMQFPLGSTPQQRHEWANTWAWFIRVAEYDKHLDSVRLAEKEARIQEEEKDYGDARKRALTAAFAVAENELRKWEESSFASDMPIKSDPTLIKLFSEVVKLSRLEEGKTTENIQTRDDYSDLPLDLLKKMQSLLSEIDEYRRKH